MSEITKLDHVTIRRLRSEASVVDVTSAIKELIENSIDAEATIIQINLVACGIEKITIKDNGIGMPLESLKACCQRYCTSKISSYDDLSNWLGMGFKGEALACLADLSQSVTITSRSSKEGTESAYSVTYDKDGNCIENSISPAALSKGTIVVVKGFFDAYPVRKKHFDANKERKKIVRLISEYSIAMPHIRFHLLDTQFSSILKPSTTENDVMGSLTHLYGLDTIDEMKLIKVESKDIIEVASNLDLEEADEHPSFGIKKILLALPKGDLPDLEFTSKTSSTCMFSMINRRPVDLPILKDIAKRWRLHFDKPIKRFPIAIVHLFLEPNTIDINLSSDKRQVIMQFEKSIIKIIEHYVSLEYPKSTLVSLSPSKQTPVHTPSDKQPSTLSPTSQTSVQTSIRETFQPIPLSFDDEACTPSGKVGSITPSSSEDIATPKKIRKVSEVFDEDTVDENESTVIDDTQSQSVSQLEKEFVPFQQKPPKRLVKKTKVPKATEYDVESSYSKYWESLKIIGRVDKPFKGFIVKMGDALLVANPQRIIESVIFNELIHEYGVSKHTMDPPITLSFMRFCRLFNQAYKDEEDEDLVYQCWKALISTTNDPIFDLNGYKIERNNDSEAKIVSVSSLIIEENPDDTLKGTACKEVFELLRSIAKDNTTGPTRTESTKRHFLRLVRDEIKSLKVEDFNEKKLDTVIKRIQLHPHLYESLKCPHGKPFFGRISDIS